MSTLKGRDEAVFPTLKTRQHRNIGRAERVFALPESVGKLPGHDQLCDLRLAHDQLCAVLDGLVLIGKAPRQSVTGIVDPLNDFEQLAAEEIDQAHRMK